VSGSVGDAHSHRGRQHRGGWLYIFDAVGLFGGRMAAFQKMWKEVIPSLGSTAMRQ
jgi:hypothetical protein